MPAGVSWSTYTKFLIAAGLSMFTGSQIVHLMYQPLEDMDEFIAEEYEKIQAKKKETSQNNSLQSSEA